jgi:hypothetical protein
LILLATASCVLAGPLPGTILTDPGTTVTPGLVAPGTPAGTLLASLVTPFSFATTAGNTSGTLTSAVFRESSGTLDFYYQVANSGASATALSREADTSFAGFTTFTGYRTDAVVAFAVGTVAPVSADRNSTGALMGFSFSPPDAAKILPGLTSDILVISTNATLFAAGNASVIDGGTETVASFQPAVAAVPEPGTLLLLGAGLLAAPFFRRVWRKL